MNADPRCAEVRERLAEALLARRPAAAGDLAHADACAACAARAAGLARLAESLEADPEPLLPDAVAARVRAAALRELMAETPAPAGLPPGFARELARLLAWAALPLPLVALCLLAALQLGGALLPGWLPDAVAAWLGFALVSSAACWLALIYGSLPFVAYHRAGRRPEGGAG